MPISPLAGLSDEATTIKELERLIGMTQQKAVDEFIETSC